MRGVLGLLPLCLAPACGEGGATPIDAVARPIRFEVDARGLRSLRAAPTTDDPARSILFAGHLRGDGDGPSPEFTAALPRLARQADTLVLLGDLTADTGRPELAAQVRADVFERFPGQVLVAPGNHDVSDRAALAALLGAPTYREARACGGAAALVVLDTELDPAGITGEQLAFFRETIARIRGDRAVRFVFVCCHKFVWFPGRPSFREFYEKGLNWTGAELARAYPPTNFWSEVFPPLRELTAAGMVVFVLGGDLGFRLRAMCAEHEGVVFLGTGMGRPGTGNTYLHFTLEGGAMVCVERAF